MIFRKRIFTYPLFKFGKGTLRSNAIRVNSEGETFPMDDLQIQLLSQSNKEFLTTTTTDELGYFEFIDLDVEQLYMLYAHYPEDTEGKPMRTITFTQKPRYQSAMVSYLQAEEEEYDYPPITNI